MGKKRGWRMCVCVAEGRIDSVLPVETCADASQAKGAELRQIEKAEHRQAVVSTVSLLFNEVTMHLRGVLLCFEMMFVSVGLLIPFF